MNLKLRIINLMLGMMTLMPSISFAYNSSDSTLLHRIWNYRRNYSFPVSGMEQNVYMRQTFNMDRRNVLLFLVPTMYVIADGDREFVSESYCKVHYRDVDDYDVKRQVVCGTIPRQREAMPPMLEFSSPDFYDETLYPNHLLSPFNYANHRHYRFTIGADVGGLAMVHFKPKTKNTQLVSGHAIVDTQTGRLQSIQLRGESDMITFRVSARMNANDIHNPLPERCHTEAKFRFMGNRVFASMSVVYNCPETLPDSLDEEEDWQLMESLRPIPLDEPSQKIYRDYQRQRELDREEAARNAAIDTVEHHNYFKEIGWDIIGYHLVRSHKAEVGGVSIRFSPILNPQYLSYSPSRGLSYKMRFGMQYRWNDHRYMTLNPQLGFNFKLKQIFYTAPLRMNYNPKRNGYAEIKVGNGNHISNGLLEDEFKALTKDSISMPEYKDFFVEAVNNVVAFDWLEITSGLVYHQRHSLESEVMQSVGLPDKFISFAPMLSLKLTPWRKGPVLTVDYELGLKNILNSDMEYRRWEFDASYLHRMKSLKIFNVRAGAGFYAKRNSTYFVDYTHFRDNNLPTGWEDDWSGQFQLLDSKWYNSSNYYLRGHMSYDSPLIAFSYLPIIGRYIEAERIYLSALSIEHTRPYFEVGYGFANRIFSMGLFASFLGTKYQSFGCKITLELFRRW